MSAGSPSPETTLPESADVALRQLRFGWWALLVFLSLGVVLELLNGFKVPFYMDVSNETRRHLWTLGHAHGTLVALVNVALGLCLRVVPAIPAVPRDRAVLCLRAAAVLLPGGFLLGDAVIYAGDTGLGIALVPVGAVLLFLGVLFTARGLREVA